MQLSNLFAMMQLQNQQYEATLSPSQAAQFQARQNTAVAQAFQENHQIFDNLFPTAPNTGSPAEPTFGSNPEIGSVIGLLLGCIDELASHWGDLPGVTQYPPEEQSPGALSTPPQPIPVNSTDSQGAQSIKNSYNNYLEGINNLPFGSSTVNGATFTKTQDADGNVVVTSSTTNNSLTEDTGPDTTDTSMVLSPNGNMQIQETLNQGASLNGGNTSTTEGLTYTRGADGGLQLSSNGGYGNVTVNANPDGSTSTSDDPLAVFDTLTSVGGFLSNVPGGQAAESNFGSYVGGTAQVAGARPMPIQPDDSAKAQCLKQTYNAILTGVQNVPLGQSESTDGSATYNTTINSSGDKVVQATYNGSLVSTTTLDTNGSISVTVPSGSEGGSDIQFTPTAGGGLTFNAPDGVFTANPDGTTSQTNQFVNLLDVSGFFPGSQEAYDALNGFNNDVTIT